MLSPKTGGGRIGRLQPRDANRDPIWQVAQWHSRFPWADLASVREDGLGATNAAKWLALVASADERPTLTLGVDSRPEYKHTLRQSSAEPWVHLLLQQDIQDAPPLSELASLTLQFEVRLTESETFRPRGYSTSLHAAQFQIVLTLNNTRPGSPGFGDYLWFVVPCYDDRHALPPAYVAQDFAVTQGKLIFNPGAQAAGLRPLRLGEWQTLDCELRPWLERALQEAWAKGYLRDSRDLADYRVAHLNVGWEVPGLNRVAMDLRGLSLRGQTRSPENDRN